MRPRRSLSFVAPATPADSTSCKPPAPATRPFRFFTNHESRNTNHGLYAFLAAFLRVAARHGASMARHGRGRRPPHRQHGLLVFTNHATPHLSPFGSPWVRRGRTTENRRPDRRARRQVTASLFTIVRHCSLLFTIFFMEGVLNKCPRTVRRSWSASRRMPFSAAPAALPRLRKHGNVFCCVDS